MRILFLSGVLPHPKVTSGYAMVHQRIKRLAERGHEVALASFCFEEDMDKAELIKDHLVEMELIPTPPPRSCPKCLFDFLSSSVPYWYSRYKSKAMSKAVGDMVERTRYDVVLAEFSAMGQHIYRNPYLPAVRKVISCHHSETMVHETAVEVLGWSPEGIKERIRMKGLRKYEYEMYESMDRVLALTPQERYGMLDHAPNLRISVVPNGVDVEYYKPREHESTESCIIYVGRYKDEENEDAVLWFCQTVWPRLKERHPELEFYVVGPEPTEAIRDLSRKDPKIIVTGLVKDIRPYLAKAQVFICPVRMGTGMRGKILEAMASGVPVVSTTLGVEGIPAQVGDNCYLADRPDIMANSIDLLLGDLPLRRSIAQRARDMVVERFSWDIGVGRLEEVLREVVNAK